MEATQEMKGRVLIVDDTPHNLEVVCAFLQAINLNTAVAETGEDALDVVEHITPDLILLDVMMPGIDGFETCKRLKSNLKTASIPVIFMTALADTESKVKGLKIGAVDYVTKPFQQTELLARIGIHLKLHQMVQAIATTNHLLNQKIQEQAATETKLRDALKELKTAQNHLIQVEKLSSLGRMVGGIAHEINNPLSFIQGNLRHLEKYAQELIKTVGLYQQTPPDLIPTLREQIRQSDLSYILGDLPNLLRSMATGALRIGVVVDCLRSFAHLDQSTEKTINLHAAIDNTLLLLKHRLKATQTRPAIEIHKGYAVSLPTLDCYPEYLNQAIFHLLTNAIDALDSKAISAPQLKIETDWNSAHAILRISDNGVGIVPEIYPHIFDPFFTTKPVGQGVGLGLSTTYQTIVQRHQGQLTCQSMPQQGTTFEITLPLKRSSS